MLRRRRALTLVEVLVALAVVGVAAAALASSLAADRRLRDLAAASAGASRSARARLESLAVLACAADTSGESSEGWGFDAWSARVGAMHWRLVDSLSLRRSALPWKVDARVACPQ